MTRAQTILPEEVQIGIGPQVYCLKRIEHIEGVKFLVWEAECADCGAKFECSTPTPWRSTWHFTRRCDLHKSPGRKVRYKSPGKGRHGKTGPA